MVNGVFNMFVKLVLLFSILSIIVNVDGDQAAFKYIDKFKVDDIADIHTHCYLAIFLSMEKQYYKNYDFFTKGHTFNLIRKYLGFFLRFNNGTLEQTTDIFGPEIWTLMKTVSDGCSNENSKKYHADIKTNANSIIQYFRRKEYTQLLENFYADHNVNKKVDPTKVLNMVKFCFNLTKSVSDASCSAFHDVENFIYNGSINENLNKYLLLKEYGGFSFLLKTDEFQNYRKLEGIQSEYKFVVNILDEVLSDLFYGINHVIYSVNSTQVQNNDHKDILLAIQYTYKIAIELKEMIKKLMDKLYRKNTQKVITQAVAIKMLNGNDGPFDENTKCLTMNPDDPQKVITQSVTIINDDFDDVPIKETTIVLSNNFDNRYITQIVITQAITVKNDRVDDVPLNERYTSQNIEKAIREQDKQRKLINYFQSKWIELFPQYAENNKNLSQDFLSNIKDNVNKYQQINSEYIPGRLLKKNENGSIKIEPTLFYYYSIQNKNLTDPIFVNNNNMTIKKIILLDLYAWAGLSASYGYNMLNNLSLSDDGKFELYTPNCSDEYGKDKNFMVDFINKFNLKQEDDDCMTMSTIDHNV